MKKWLFIALAAAFAFAFGILLSRVFQISAINSRPRVAEPIGTVRPFADDSVQSPAAKPAAGAEQVTADATAPAGKALFDKACASCHNIGGGDKVGPDLNGVATRRPVEWLRRMITEPDRLRLERDPVSLELFETYNRIAMPNLGLSLSDADAVLSYIKNATTSTPPAAQ